MVGRPLYGLVLLEPFYCSWPVRSSASNGFGNPPTLLLKLRLKKNKCLPIIPSSLLLVAGNIVTFGQSGGQNVINQAPKPELKQLHNDVRQNSDGSQTISILTEVVAAYPPGSLFIQATAPHIAALNVIPQRTGMSMTGHTEQRKNYAFTTLMNPFGTYMIDVQTSKPEQVTIEYHFE